jgi:hypothetical protein
MTPKYKQLAIFEISLADMGMIEFTVVQRVSCQLFEWLNLELFVYCKLSSQAKPQY